ncbi:MAG: hypothetical protein QXD23_00855 [Candidatus Micrarchaeaceae archaeon]
MVSKLCHICNKIANTICKLCGRPVCEKHKNKHEVCDSCASGLH